MVYFSIIVFLACIYLLGLSITFFLKNSDNFLERNLMRIGLGLSIFPLLGLLLNITKIPLDWRIFLVISLICPVYYLIKNRQRLSFSFKITKDDLSTLIMLLIFTANLYIYASGAFKYPYLEDDDPWSHAMGVKFVSIEKRVFEGTPNILHYIDPYPPSYDLLLGVIHQTNDSMYFTLKFFNALIISFSTIFFYFFVRKLTGKRNRALFATFMLFSLPAFLSHFIWALSLTVPLYFVAFYALEMINQDKKWWIVSGLAMVTVLTSSPTHSAYFVFLSMIYVTYKFISEKKFPKHEVLAIATGALLCFALWWGPMLLKHGFVKTLEGTGFGVKIITEEGKIGAAFGGTGDRVYNFDDFYNAKESNMVNNPIGLGKVATLLTAISIFLSYWYIYSSIKKTKDDSPKKYRILILSVAVSFIMFLIGMGYWVSTAGLDPQSNASQLEAALKDSFPYIFSAFGILVLLYCVVLNKIDENKKWVLLAMAWLVFSFYAVNAAIYPVKLSPFRSWMILAIPVSMLCSEAFAFLWSLTKSSLGKYAGILLIAVLLFGIYHTSLKQKIAVNTSPNWPPGGFWTSGEEIGGYIWLKDNIPSGSKTFTFVNNAPIIGFDKYTCHWCPDIRDYQRGPGFNQTAKDNYNWLKKNNYQYIIIDGQTARKFGSNLTTEKIKNMFESGLYQPIFQNPGMIIMKI